MIYFFTALKTYIELLRVNIRFQFPSLAAVDYPKNATGSKFDGLWQLIKNNLCSLIFKNH